MEFELAYDLPVEVDKEVVFVLIEDRNRKVRLLVTAVDDQGDQISFVGNSFGSSVRAIKAAKRDEPAVVVNGTMTRLDGVWTATLAAG